MGELSDDTSRKTFLTVTRLMCITFKKGLGEFAACQTNNRVPVKNDIFGWDIKLCTILGMCSLI